MKKNPNFAPKIVSMNSYSSSSSTLKSRFTRRFLQALVKINNGQEIEVNCHDVHRRRRYRRVRIAADKSLALAVGSRRSWSRALLCKIRTQKRHRCAWTRRNIKGENHQYHCLGLRGQSRELQKLVPGSKGMDFCSLLDETAHYIKCLATQVQAMHDMYCSFNSCNSST